TNHASHLSLSGNRVYVRYVLDLAEIPAYRERPAISRLGRTAYLDQLVGRIGRGLDLRADGRRLALTPVRRALAFPPGAAGLHTERAEVVYQTAPLTPGADVSLSFADRTYPDRTGWKEVVVDGTAGASLLRSSAP